MDNIEEPLLNTNSPTSCLSTSTVRKYLPNIVRKLSYTAYTVGTGLIVYGVGSCIYELIENKDENKKNFDDTSLKIFLSGAATIVIGKVLEVTAKFCDNSNNIENRLDQSVTGLPSHENATLENSFDIIESNETPPPTYDEIIHQTTSRSETPPPTYDEFIQNANNESNHPEIVVHSTTMQPTLSA